MNLFRNEVNQNKVRIGLIGEASLVPPGIAIYGFIIAIICIISATALIIFGNISTRQAFPGRLIPRGGEIAVTANASGIAKQLFVSEGDNVKAGAPLLSISTIQYSKSTNSIEQLVAEQIGKKTMIVNSLIKNRENELSISISKLNDKLNLEKKSLIEIDKQIKLQQERIDNATELLNRLSTFGNAVVTRNQLVQQRDLILSYKSTLSDLIQRKHQAQNELLKGQQELNEVNNQYKRQKSELSLQLTDIKEREYKNEFESEYTLRAPTEGVIGNIAVMVGNSVGRDQNVLNLFPDNDLIVEFWVSTKIAPTLKLKDKVTIEFEAFPKQFHGTLKCSIFYISHSPVSEELARKSLGEDIKSKQYRVLASIDSNQQNQLSSKIPLAPGMVITGITTRQYKISNFIFQ